MLPASARRKKIAYGFQPWVSIVLGHPSFPSPSGTKESSASLFSVKRRMADLPHCDELFLRFFDPWYSDDDRQRKGFKATRPDLLRSDDYIGTTGEIASPLTPEFQAEAMRRIATMTRAASSDFGRSLDLHGDIDLTWIETIDAHYDTVRIAEMIESSDPGDFSNDYLITCIEFGAILGHVIKSLQPRLFWSPDWPYWESTLIDPVSGYSLPVFHWAIKKMSSYGWDDGFAEKVEATIAFLDRKKDD